GAAPGLAGGRSIVRRAGRRAATRWRHRATAGELFCADRSRGCDERRACNQVHRGAAARIRAAPVARLSRGGGARDRCPVAQLNPCAAAAGRAVLYGVPQSAQTTTSTVT